MDCLVGYIGLSKSIAGTVESGLYLNALPGISLDSVNGIANSEQVDYMSVLKDVETRSIAKFRTFFTREMNRCWKISDRAIIECIICENKALLAISIWYLMGAELMLEKINSERVNKFTTISKKDYQELNNEFMDSFYAELSTAVAGIDIDSSSCIEDEEVESNNVVQLVYTHP